MPGYWHWISACASGHSVETGWPSGVRLSQLSCPFEGDKWISRITQVRSPGVKNWLFSHASTSVLPGCLCMLIRGVFTFDLVPQNVYPCETTYASQMQTPSTDACYTFKSVPLEASMQNWLSPNIYLKGRIVEVGKHNYFLKGHYKFEPKVGDLLSDHRQGMSIPHVSISHACKPGWVTEPFP